MQTLAPKIKLNNGQEIPALGLGTWRSYTADAEQAVKHAIDIGYRYIDTAFVYENELEVGNAIRSKINEGVIKREDIIVVSKLRGLHEDSKMIESECRKSLKNLGLNYVDLYLMHYPEKRAYARLKFNDVDYLKTWYGMEKLIEQDLVRGIGLSNFNIEQIERILKNCNIKPVINQVECHPEFNQQELIQFTRVHGIVIAANCPLARSQSRYRRPSFIYDKVVKSLAKKFGKTTAQICLRYLIQLGTIPIPRSVERKYIEENFLIFDFELSAEDMKIMDKYDRNHRMYLYGYGCQSVMAPPDY